jgi:hypothetical protein
LVRRATWRCDAAAAVAALAAAAPINGRQDTAQRRVAKSLQPGPAEQQNALAPRGGHGHGQGRDRREARLPGQREQLRARGPIPAAVLRELKSDAAGPDARNGAAHAALASPERGRLLGVADTAKYRAVRSLEPVRAHGDHSPAALGHDARLEGADHEIVVVEKDQPRLSADRLRGRGAGKVQERGARLGGRCRSALELGVGHEPRIDRALAEYAAERLRKLREVRAAHAHHSAARGGARGRRQRVRVEMRAGKGLQDGGSTRRRHAIGQE